MNATPLSQPLGDALFLDDKRINLTENKWYYEPFPRIIFEKQRSTLEIDPAFPHPRVTNMDLCYILSQLKDDINWNKGITLIRNVLTGDTPLRPSCRGGDIGVKITTYCAVLTPSNLHGIINPLKYAQLFPRAYYILLEKICPIEDLRTLILEFIGIKFIS